LLLASVFELPLSVLLLVINLLVAWVQPPVGPPLCFYYAACQPSARLA
jgi:hypothetical protein